MAQKTKQWGAIIIMIALFAMIAFVTNLCTPMATIIKNQGPISNVLAQIGNYGNFIASWSCICCLPDWCFYRRSVYVYP